MLTTDQLIAIMRANCDPGWLDPLLDDPDCNAILTGIAAIFSRVSQSVDSVAADGTIFLASGGVPGTSLVTLTRAPSGPAGTLPLGTTYIDAEGFLFATTSPNAYGAGATTLVANVQSLRQTELVNTVDDPQMLGAPTYYVADATDASPVVLATTTPHGFTTGQTVSVVGVTGNAGANVVTTVTVVDSTHLSLDGSTGTGAYAGGGTVSLAVGGWVPASSTPVTGGQTDFLSAQGAERGTLRQAGELTADYRARVRNIPDAVSPSAIATAAAAATQNTPLAPFELLEPFDLGESTAAKAAINLGSLEPAFYYQNSNPTLNADGATFADAPGSIALNFREALAYFRLFSSELVLVSGAPTLLADDGLFANTGPYLLPADQRSALLALINSLWQTVNGKRAGGVQFDIILTPWIWYPNSTVGPTSTTSSSTSPTAVYSMSPPAGKIWQVIEIIAGLYSSDTPSGSTPSVPPSATFTVTLAIEGGGTVSFSGGPWSSVSHGVPRDSFLSGGTTPPLPGIRFSGITGTVTSDGTAHVGILLNVLVLELPA